MEHYIKKYQQRLRVILQKCKDGTYPCRSAVIERYEEGSPIGRLEWDTTWERLNSYERYLLMSLVENDILLEAADYCAKNSQQRGWPLPGCYDEALKFEYAPLLADRLKLASEFAEKLGRDVIQKLEPDNLPYKLTRVSVARLNAVPWMNKRVVENLEKFGHLVEHFGAKELFWHSPYECEFMATAVQQYRLAQALGGDPAPQWWSVGYAILWDEGAYDRMETLAHCYNWSVPLIEKAAKDAGCRQISLLHSDDCGPKLFCLATKEQKSKLKQALKPVHGYLTHLHSSPGVVRRRSWPEPVCPCVDYSSDETANTDCHLCEGTGKGAFYQIV